MFLKIFNVEHGAGAMPRESSLLEAAAEGKWKRTSNGYRDELFFADG
jgi:hypothetical protein